MSGIPNTCDYNVGDDLNLDGKHYVLTLNRRGTKTWKMVEDDSDEEVVEETVVTWCNVCHQDKHQCMCPSEETEMVEDLCHRCHQPTYRCMCGDDVVSVVETVAESTVDSDDGFVRAISQLSPLSRMNRVSHHSKPFSLTLDETVEKKCDDDSSSSTSSEVVVEEVIVDADADVAEVVEQLETKHKVHNPFSKRGMMKCGEEKEKMCEEWEEEEVVVNECDRCDENACYDCVEVSKTVTNKVVDKKCEMSECGEKKGEGGITVIEPCSKDFEPYTIADTNLPAHLLPFINAPNSDLKTKMHKQLGTWVVYGIDKCLPCANTKEFLSEHNQKIFYLNDATATEEQKKWISEYVPAEHTTFPKIVLNNKFIGGYTDLVNSSYFQ